MSLHPWISKIKDLDNCRIIQCKRVAEAVEEAMRSNKKPFTTSSCYANTTSSDSKTVPSTSSSSTRDYPLKLTDKERQLGLMEHSGCLKCRKFYAGHRAHQCLTTISGKGYKTLTTQDALRAKSAQKSKGSSSHTIAAITDAFPANETADFIASVFPSLPSGAVGNGSHSEASDNSFGSMSAPPPFKSKHFIWHSSLTGPLVDFPVKVPSLIDNGCHMVLIRPDIVEKLGLPIFTLPEPEEVDVVISFSKTGVTRNKKSLVHYVKIRPSSSDSVFQSCLLHAIICPGLCMPLIFGLPFLEINDVICDHKRRACIVNDRKLNYNLLTPLTRQQPTPPKLRLRDQLLQNKSHKIATLRELLEIFPKKWKARIIPDVPEIIPNYIASILHHLKNLKIEASMTDIDMNLRKSFPKVLPYSPPYPTLTTFHLNPLPI